MVIFWLSFKLAPYFATKSSSGRNRPSFIKGVIEPFVTSLAENSEGFADNAATCNLLWSTECVTLKSTSDPAQLFTSSIKILYVLNSLARMLIEPSVGPQGE